MSLTAKQRIFVEQYLICWNASEAARRAGYSVKTAGSIGSENLKKPEIADAIRARKAEIDAEFEHRIMGRFEVLARLSAIAAGDIGDLGFGSADFIKKAKEAGKSFLIKKVEETTFVNGADDTETHTTKLELYSAHEALRDLGKYHALFIDKSEVSGANGGPINLRVIWDDKIPPETAADE